MCSISDHLIKTHLKKYHLCLICLILLNKMFHGNGAENLNGNVFSIIVITFETSHPEYNLLRRHVQNQKSCFMFMAINCIISIWMYLRLVSSQGNDTSQKYTSPSPTTAYDIPFKLLEHMVVSTIMGYVEEHQNHCLEQHGFCWGKSCESQLLGFVDVVSAAVEKGCQEDVLIMDFSEAFDKVSNSLLLHKLPQYGISGRVKWWVKNFLRSSEHRQFHQWLKIAFVPVESGVP